MIDQPQISLPQTNSLAGKNQEGFTFEELGQEEFLAIALEQPLNLDWFVPCEKESLPECKGQRFKELFEQLAEQGKWQVFYQSFEVVQTA